MAATLTGLLVGGVQLLFSERDGRVRAPIGGLPADVMAVTVPVRRNGQGHVPRDKRGRPKIEIVDLIAAGPTSAFAPPASLNSRDLIFALETGKHEWSTVADHFGETRAWEAAISLVRCGGVILRCEADEDLELGLPLSWRRSHAWSLQHTDLLNDLRGRPDPDGLRAELIQLMAPVAELVEERSLLQAVSAGSPLRVPSGTATKAGAWSVYENALRAAAIWFPHNAKGTEKLTANDLAGRAFRNSKEWTPEREAAFANLIGKGFDQAVDEADTDLRVRGPLKWLMGSVAADAGIAEPWVALPARGLRAAGGLVCEASGVLIVENADSFEKVCKIPGLTKNWLCIWGKGYSLTSTSIVALLSDMSSLPFAAWCDLDADGIKIIDVLEGKLKRPIDPVGMDLELWVKTPHRKQKPEQIARDKKLAKGLATSGPEALRALAREIELYGGSCEQQPVHEQVLPTLLESLTGLLDRHASAR